MYDASLLSEFVHAPCKVIADQTTGHNACIRVTSPVYLLRHSSKQVLIGFKFMLLYADFFLSLNKKKIGRDFL